MLILNDLHAGVRRVAGTTATSSNELNQYLVDWLDQTLAGTKEDVLFLGDLFDSHNIDNKILVKLYTTILDFIRIRKFKVILVRGNHDVSKDSSRLSSLQMLYLLVHEALPNELKKLIQFVESAPAEIDDGVITIPHLINQDDFSAALTDVLISRPKYLLLHCNYDNGFALEQDHSLNLSEEIALEFNKVGTKILIAHEHHKWVTPAPNVIILGNQVPTSIIDCMNGGKSKYMHRLSSDGVTQISTWHPDDEFIQVDWHDIDEEALSGYNDYKFIRIVGPATLEEWPTAQKLVNQARKVLPAFIVSSAVSLVTEDAAGEEYVVSSLEKLSAFDVIAELVSCLSGEKHKEIIKTLSKEMGHD